MGYDIKKNNKIRPVIILPILILFIGFWSGYTIRNIKSQERHLNSKEDFKKYNQKKTNLNNEINSQNRNNNSNTLAPTKSLDSKSETTSSKSTFNEKNSQFNSTSKKTLNQKNTNKNNLNKNIEINTKLNKKITKKINKKAYDLNYPEVFTHKNIFSVSLSNIYIYKDKNSKITKFLEDFFKIPKMWSRNDELLVTLNITNIHKRKELEVWSPNRGKYEPSMIPGLNSIILKDNFGRTFDGGGTESWFSKKIIPGSKISMLLSFDAPQTNIEYLMLSINLKRLLPYISIEGPYYFDPILFYKIKSDQIAR